MLLAMGHALHIWSKRFYRPWTVIQGGIKWQKYEKNYLRYRLSKCLTRREGDRLNYEKKTDMTHLSTWIHYLDVKQASQGVIGYANHVLHPQHTAGRLSQKDLDKQRITRLQRPFKGSSTDGIMIQAIGYRPWTWSMLKLSIHSHIMYKNITKTWIIFIFIGDLWSYLNISLVPKAKKEKIAKFPSRSLEKYGNIKRKTSIQWHVPAVCCGWRTWLAYPITPWEACLTSK